MSFCAHLCVHANAFLCEPVQSECVGVLNLECCTLCKKWYWPRKRAWPESWHSHSATGERQAESLNRPTQGSTLCYPQVINHPLPIIPTEAAARVRQDASALLLVVCLTLAASVLSASFCVFLVRYDELPMYLARYAFAFSWLPQ